MKLPFNSISYFEIQSSDLPREIKFYETVFGWKFVHDPNIPVEYYRIETPTLAGALLKRPAKVPPQEHGTNAYCNSVMVEDYDRTEKLILENGGIVALPKFAIPGKCWQGYYMDADHNVFGIFQIDEEAK